MDTGTDSELVHLTSLTKSPNLITAGAQGPKPNKSPKKLIRSTERQRTKGGGSTNDKQTQTNRNI